MAWIKRDVARIPLTVESFITNEGRSLFRQGMVKMAQRDPSVVERLGKQSLYGEPDSIIKRYMANGFDIVSAMKEKQHSGAIIWVRARAIDAGVINANGDFFTWEELTKDVTIETGSEKKVMPAYKTFEGKPIYTNHKNDDIQQAKGAIVFAEADEENQCIYCTFFIDAEAYPDIARSIRMGVITDVSMGCQVEWSECSICGHKAEKEADWCDHLKKYKGKKFSGVIDSGSRKGQSVQGERVYEINHDISFIELSAVSDGAYSDCEIEEILPHSEVITYAEKLRKTAGSAKDLAARGIREVLGASASPEGQELIEVLSGFETLASKMETLSSETMTKVAMRRQAEYVSVLDSLNGVLNNLEAVIINLLSRKDNIDLTHVAKLSKAMSDIQQEVSDMIDDGIGTLTDNTMNSQQPQQAPQAEGQQAPPGDYAAAGDVGMMMAPPQTANQSFDMMGDVPMQISPMTMPGGIGLAAERENTGLLKAAAKISSLSESVGSVLSEMGVQQATPGGETTMATIYDLMAQNLMKRTASTVSLDAKATSKDGKYCVAIVDNGSDILASVEGEVVDWEPTTEITNEDYQALVSERRPERIAQKLLEDFVKDVNSGRVVTAAPEPKMLNKVREHTLGDDAGVHGRKGNPKDVQEHQVAPKRTGTEVDVQEHLLQSKAGPHNRRGTPVKVREQLLGGEEAGLYGRKGNPKDVQEHQLADERLDTEVKVHEHRLAPRRSKSTASADRIVASSIDAIGRAIVASDSTPTLALSAISSFDFEDLHGRIVESAEDYEYRMEMEEKVEIGSAPYVRPSIKQAMIDNLADIVATSGDISSWDLADTVVQMPDVEKGGMRTRLAKAAQVHNNNRFASFEDESDDDASVMLRGALNAAIGTDNDEPVSVAYMKIAVMAAADAVIDSGVTPDEVFESLEGLGDSEAIATVSAGRLPQSIAKRVKEKERRAFWGRVAKQSDPDESDIRKAFLGNLADYCEAAKESEGREFSSGVAWNAAKRLAAAGDDAHVLVASAVAARGFDKNAAVSMTDRTETVREIRMHIDEIGVPANSSDFEDATRRFAINMLQKRGYKVDPETFSFTELNVDEDSGDVLGIVKSTVVKTFSEEDTEEISELEAVEPGFDEGMDDAGAIMTPYAMKKRREYRQAALNGRTAQQMGGGAAGGGGGEMGGGMAAGGLTPPETGGPGLSSLLGPEGPDMGEGEGSETDLDAVNEPGGIAPIGTLCPSCGSRNTELAELHGKCKDCGTDYDVSISIQNINTPSEDEGRDDEEGGLGEEPEGLGAALAPPGPEAGGMGAAPAAGPAAPGGAEAGGGFPAMAAAFTWYSDPDTFRRYAQAKKNYRLADSQIKGPKMPGSHCVVCGNKEVTRADSKYFCEACTTMGLVKIAMANRFEGDTALKSTVTVLLPDPSDIN